MNQTITKIYFSPTGNTKASVDAVASAISSEYIEYDVTVDDSDEPRTLAQTDFAVIGVPVYSGRVPVLAASRLARFRGNQTPCIILATYGNRHYDDALLELYDLMQAQGFLVKGAAALVGRHTYGDIQADRPDGNDLVADREFARKAFEKEYLQPFEIYGKRPYRDGGYGGKFRPLTNEDCISCGLCAAQCPAHAIAPDFRTLSDDCIACFRCIRNCPVGAKHMNTELYLSFSIEFSERLKNRRENEYFL